MATTIIKPTSCAWFRDAIVYHILVDRFAGYRKVINPQKPVFIGGNLKGIEGKIPYLVELGVNTLWLSPVYETTAYHGYHITDFYSTDKHFGTEKDLKSLVDLCHQKNIRVLLDFVPNHCSNQHPYFREAIKNKSSRYHKWFYFTRSGNKYLCFLNFHDLPKINLDYPAARDHIIGAARHWLQLGVDGFRLDHAVGPSHKFWKIFRSEIKSVNPEAILIGEAWLEGINFGMLKTINIKKKYLRWLFRFNPWDIEREYIGEMDGVLDFYFRHRLTEYIAWKDDPECYKNKLATAMSNHYQRFPENYCLPSFIDNHDMNRFLFDAGQSREKLKMALKFQFSLPQPPILYYGTETGLTHNGKVQWDIPYSDIFARQPMPWEKLDYEMIDFSKELIRKRRLG
jgi:glycosidase